VNKAFDALTTELSKADKPLYNFIPDEVESNFFIGEAIIAGAAVALVQGFVKGANSSLEKKGEEAGKKAGKWVADKIGKLFKKKEEGKDEQTNLENDVKELANNASKADAPALEQAYKTSEIIIMTLLKEQGISEKRAAQIANSVRKAAESTINET
jgi:hypothetical protein